MKNIINYKIVIISISLLLSVAAIPTEYYAIYNFNEHGSNAIHFKQSAIITMSNVLIIPPTYVATRVGCECGFYSEVKDFWGRNTPSFYRSSIEHILLSFPFWVIVLSAFFY